MPETLAFKPRLTKCVVWDSVSVLACLYWVRPKEQVSGSSSRAQDELEGKGHVQRQLISLFLIAVNVYDGEHLNLTRISRTEMGAYLCIATNGIPPSVSKRIIVDVECEYLFLIILKCLIQLVVEN